LGFADLGADLHVLARLPEQRDAGDRGGGLSQSGQNFSRARPALGERLEIDHDPAGVERRVVADPIIRASDVGIGHDDTG